MAGPHPVVRIRSKLANAAGRRSHQTNVRISLGNNQDVLQTVVNGFDGVQIVGVGFFEFRQVVCYGLGYLRIAICLAHLKRHVFEYYRRDVFHALDEIHKKTRIGLFFLLVFRPKTVREVIIF